LKRRAPKAKPFCITYIALRERAYSNLKFVDTALLTAKSVDNINDLSTS